MLRILNEHRKKKSIKYYYELKFRKLRRKGRPVELAKLWLQEIVNDANNSFYFKILGIKKDNLLFELFGGDSTPTGKYADIYNRFFRTAFIGAVNSYFPEKEYAKVIISRLFHHHQPHLQSHKLFPWHLCHKIAGSRIEFSSNEVCFIESNHKLEQIYKDDSHFIQLIDVLVGSISHCLDLPSPNEGKNEVAKVILPMLKDIVGGVYSTKSRFNYFRKYDVQFFPKAGITLEEFSNDAGRVQSDFFRNRSILLEEHLFGRQSEFCF